MTITIVTAIWGRDELTKIVLAYYSDLAVLLAEEGISLHLCCTGSVGEHSRAITNGAGWHYTEHQNNPVSQKFNAVFKAAEATNPDLVVLIGSDDLISPEVFRFYAATVKPTHPCLVGLKDLYFYSISEGQTLHFPGYGDPAPKTIGAGRCYSRHILNMLQWQPWGNEQLNRGLDSASTARMRRMGIYEQSYTMAETSGIAVDIKDKQTALTPLSRLQARSQVITSDVLDKHFPVEMDAVRGLQKMPIFEKNKMYEVEITKPSHRMFGKKMKVLGSVASDLLIKNCIKQP